MLLKYIHKEYKTISIVGMAKNSGKTVALNHLIHESIEEGIKLGILSTGRDGEFLDLVTETEKPRIYVEEGIIIGTTTELLAQSDATVEILSITDYKTPLGDLLIGRVRAQGYVQISGPQTVKGIKDLADLMLKMGADMVLMDGAIDRKSSASPSITQATILSTGAVLSRDMNRVIEETIHIVNLFSLPQVEGDRERKALLEALNDGEISLFDRDLKPRPLDIKTALNSGHIIGDNIKDHTRYVVIPGSLTKTTLADIINSTSRYKMVDIVVADGTKIFIPPRDWLKFNRYGIRVRVLNPINLIAITLNPYAPQGYYFESEELLKRMKHYIKDIPVIDLVLGGS